MGALAIRNCAKLTLYAIGRGFVEIAQTRKRSGKS